MNAIGRNLILFMATGALSGYAPIMPGTVGSVVGIGLFLIIARLSFPLLLLTSIAFIFLSIWIADRAEPFFKIKDPPHIVIDEVAGYLITMISFPPTWAYISGGFILFRIMDICKPYPIGWIEKNLAGGPGIVLDDVLAGVYANVILQAIGYFL